MSNEALANRLLVEGIPIKLAVINNPKQLLPGLRLVRWFAENGVELGCLKVVEEDSSVLLEHGAYYLRLAYVSHLIHSSPKYAVFMERPTLNAAQLLFNGVYAGRTLLRLYHTYYRHNVRRAVARVASLYTGGQLAAATGPVRKKDLLIIYDIDLVYDREFNEDWTAALGEPSARHVHLTAEEIGWWSEVSMIDESDAWTVWRVGRDQQPDEHLRIMMARLGEGVEPGSTPTRRVILAVHFQVVGGEN
jgi:hypothetical protein